MMWLLLPCSFLLRASAFWTNNFAWIGQVEALILRQPTRPCLYKAFAPATSLQAAPHVDDAGSSLATPRRTQFRQDLDHDDVSPYLATFNATLQFPSYNELLNLRVGEFVTSDRFTITTPTTETNSHQREYNFCVKLYPRGDGHKAMHTLFQKQPAKSAAASDKEGQQSGGFGMSYAVLPLFPQSSDNDKVGIYLQFLPRTTNDEVDASFALRLVGKQRTGRRFDVEWRSGMRFVSLQNTKLREGRANDFGAHLMQTRMLGFFLGATSDSNDDEDLDINNNANDPLEVHVEVYLHKKLSDSSHTSTTGAADTKLYEQQGGGFFGGRLLGIPDLRNTTDENGEHLRVGRIVVPVLRKLSERPRMFQAGVYPGVEYRLLRIVRPRKGNDDDDDDDENDLFYSQPNVDYELKPIYPLVQQLERPWPVRVPERDIPKLITPTQYNVISAVGSLVAATTALMAAFIISQAISLFFIPSKSMEPTLLKGDVVLVEKVTPRLLSALHLGPPLQVGDVVLFHPPQKLQDLVAQSSPSGGFRVRDRDLFVKRIAALPGDRVVVADKAGTVLINGQEPNEDRTLCAAEPLRLIEHYMKPGGVNDFVVEPNNVAVLGDCSSVSVDSRVWQALPTKDIVGRPLVRVWPPSRAGAVQSLPSASSRAQ
ncbi:hypothetical protein ACA910_022122 [Epithemia clementina (nom. ined.)]